MVSVGHSSSELKRLSVGKRTDDGSGNGCMPNTISSRLAAGPFILPTTKVK